ncbi:YqeB family protein [Goodfellowiella coeruleoviolacea]|uniref:DUF308 domain-containing protein n=1 Tax=Goodfellowiella coeruleoviolacea TaxID=334858 RepID=A0AAE3KK47_9PSEU|nr:hypothetical protein [Goodfellowiella coeruleoviolacea]MCP2165053.1 hypothetical protein [Goodfellowiella coeruleoviolacea]
MRNQDSSGWESTPSTAATRTEQLVVAEPMWSHLLLWLGFPLLGAVAGGLLALIADWVAGLEWAPMQGLFKLVASIPDPYGQFGGAALGVLAGLVLGAIGSNEALTVTVDAHQVGLTRGKATRTVDRARVSAVFLDGKDLTLLGPDTAPLARERCELNQGQLRHAFTTHGYPWLDGGDPHRDDYRRWIEDTPDLPAGANSLLRARGKALGSDPAEAADLAAELGKLGVAVREEGKRQYWRLVR